MTIWHYHGGCQVGSVVDHNYKVVGVSALRVIDSSTLLSSPGINPQATMMMLGRYAGTKGEKPPKNKGVSSSFEGGDIDQYDLLFLHSNDTSGVSLINFKLEEKLRKHNQLLKLMQFLIGLDEVYGPIRSIILMTDPISDVKGDFATLSRDESHRSTQSHNVSKNGNGNTTFVARTNTRNNNWSGSNNQPRKLNRPNLVCTHYNMNAHIDDRCFELFGYPSNFKKNTGTNRSSTSNYVVSGIKDQSSGSSNSFIDDQYKKQMALISKKSGSSSMLANIAVIMEYLVKISKKARILELKQRHLKITILTYNTPYPSRKIRRICACTSPKTTKDQGSIRREFTLSSLDVLQGFSFFFQMGFTLILATFDGLDVGLLGDVIGEDDYDDDG
ncbi:ribonuclease H-like domain-containing protein [Tanacetum coccineum]